MTFPRRYLFGPGILDRALKEVLMLGNKTVIITGKKWALESGILQKVIKVLQKEGVKTEALPGISPNPDHTEIDERAEKVRGENRGDSRFRCKEHSRRGAVSSRHAAFGRHAGGSDFAGRLRQQRRPRRVAFHDAERPVFNGTYFIGRDCRSFVTGPYMLNCKWNKNIN